MKEYALGVYEKALPEGLSWRERLLAARTAGYDFLEISIDESDRRLCRLEKDSAERRELAGAMEEAGLPIRSMCLSAHRKYPLGSHQPETVRRSMEIMEKAVALAEQLGIRVIMLAGYDVYYEESDAGTRSRFEENLYRCVQLAAKAGVTLAFETMETPFMDTVEKAMPHVKRVDSPWLQIYPDVGNISNAAAFCSSRVVRDLEAGGGHLVGLHLKETVPGVYRNMMYGDGQVDFQAAVETAWKLGVRRYVTEFWYLGGENWQKDLAFARTFAGDLLDRVSLT